MGMGSLSLFHWIIVIVVFGPMVWGLAKVLTRMGHSGWWSLAMFIPLGFPILLLWMGYSKWPVIENQKDWTP